MASLGIAFAVATTIGCDGSAEDDGASAGSAATEQSPSSDGLYILRAPFFAEDAKAIWNAVPGDPRPADVCMSCAKSDTKEMTIGRVIAGARWDPSLTVTRTASAESIYPVKHEAWLQIVVPRSELKSRIRGFDDSRREGQFDASGLLVRGELAKSLYEGLPGHAAGPIRCERSDACTVARDGSLLPITIQRLDSLLGSDDALTPEHIEELAASAR